MQGARVGRCRSWATTAYAGWPSTGRGVISGLGSFALSEALVSGLSSGSLFDPSEPSMSTRYLRVGCKLAKSLELVVARVDDDVRLLGVDMENVSGDLLAETLDDIRDVVGLAEGQAHVGVSGAQAVVESNRFGLLGDIRDGAQHLGLPFAHLGQRLLIVKLAVVTENEDDLLPLESTTC